MKQLTGWIAALALLVASSVPLVGADPASGFGPNDDVQCGGSFLHRW